MKMLKVGHCLRVIRTTVSYYSFGKDTVPVGANAIPYIGYFLTVSWNTISAIDKDSNYGALCSFLGARNLDASIPQASETAITPKDNQSGIST